MARVLIVDDDVISREILCEAFAEEGYETNSAADGREALDLLDRWMPDVILLDLMMPVMDGRAFIAAQRERDDARDVPVVVVSATRPLAQHITDLGVAAAFEKPYRLDALLAVVRSLAVEKS